MNYIRTKKISATLYPEQLSQIDKLISAVENDHKIKIPRTEIIRQALTIGLVELDSKRVVNGIK